MKKQSVSIFIHVTVFSKVLNTLVISRLFGKKAGHTPCFFQWNSWKLWGLVFNSSYWEYLLFIIYEKTFKKWKKHSVLIIFPCHGLNQNSSTSDLSFSQVTSVEKRKSRKHFSASASKNFSLVSFFLLW